jgi:hypothetical protein
VRGLVWTSGGNNEDIRVVLNKNENPLQWLICSGIMLTSKFIFYG